MSFLHGFAGTPQLGDKGVGNFSLFGAMGVEIPPLGAILWNTACVTPTLSTAPPEHESRFHLAKWSVIHKLGLPITTNIFK